MPVEPYPDNGVHPPLDSQVTGVAMFNPVDPRPAYAEVLARCPGARTPTGAIAVFDHETITEINRHHGISGAGGATAPLGTLGAERPLIPLDIDGPEHAMYRRVLDPMFALSLLLAWVAQHPEEQRWITADAARWPAAIEELMRFESPVMYGSRTALEDVEVGGRQYPRGTMFEVSWSAANLDPLQFSDPARVDLARTPNRHVGFASGRHSCLGSNLARLELRVCMEELHRRIPDYAVAPGESIGYTAYGVRLADPLPMVWE